MALLKTCRLSGRSPFHRYAFRCNIVVSDRNGVGFHGRELSTEQGQGGEQEGTQAQDHEHGGSMASNIPAMSSMEEKKSTNQEEGYDFRTLPELKSSFYENYELPSSMLLRKKRPPLLMKSLNLASNALFRSNQGMEAIPPFKGIPYDFGLKAIMPIPPPPLEARGGGFDMNLSFDDNLDEQSSSMEETSSLSSSVKIDPASMPLGEGYDSKSFPKLETCGLYRNHEIPNTETV